MYHYKQYYLYNLYNTYIPTLFYLYSHFDYMFSIRLMIRE